MKKILIVDDKVGRMKGFLSDEAYEYIGHKESEGIIELRDSLPTERVCEKVAQYDIVAIHGSYLEECSFEYELRKIFEEQENKFLITFSGGITQNTINGKSLDINVRNFYSDKLIEFIERFIKDEDMSQPLMVFLYGDSWRLSLYLEYRHLCWLEQTDSSSKLRMRIRKIENLLSIEESDNVESLIKEEIDKYSKL